MYNETSGLQNTTGADAAIRERGSSAAQKLCITQSAVSQRIKQQLGEYVRQPLLVRTVPPRPTEQAGKINVGSAASG